MEIELIKKDYKERSNSLNSQGHLNPEDLS